MARLHSPACSRNAQPIGDLLERLLPATGTILEIGAGTGQHAAAFSQRFPHLLWQPTDRPGTLDSILAWQQHTSAPNFLSPLPFDLFDPHPPIPTADAVFSANTLHIAPADASPRLFQHAATVLPPGAPLLVYGPFRYKSRPLEPSNQAFDQSLRQRDPQMGIRIAEDIDSMAADAGFSLASDFPMPANNRLRVWTRTG